MKSKYTVFDRNRLLLRPLAERTHDLHLDNWLNADDAPVPCSLPGLTALADRVRSARDAQAARIFMMGGHVIRAGVNRILIDLMERGFINHVAMNGAGLIHDYELARIGATTESVARYVRSGRFGLWRETGELNNWISEAADLQLGLGENVGRLLLDSSFPHVDRAFWLPLTDFPFRSRSM